MRRSRVDSHGLSEQHVQEQFAGLWCQVAELFERGVVIGLLWIDGDAPEGGDVVWQQGVAAIAEPVGALRVPDHVVF